MDYKDYYKILNIPRNAGQDEVKRAYRKLARKYHPDVSKEADAEQRFKEVGEAYEVLKDPQKRSAYDQLGPQWHAGQNFRTPPGWGEGFDFKSNVGGSGSAQFSDFFESLFGGGFGRGQSRQKRRTHSPRSKGKDHRATINISLEDSYAGITRKIQLQIPQQDEQGLLHTKTKSLNVTIPRGITEGRQIRLAGQGAPGLGGGDNGDLYLDIHFQPHRLFEVKERDIYLKLPLTPWEAALGTSLTIPTLGGKVEMTVPPNVRSGQKMRLKARGLPGNPPGDHYVVFEVMVPPADSDEAKDFYRKMAEKFDYNPRMGMFD